MSDAKGRDKLARLDELLSGEKGKQNNLKGIVDILRNAKIPPPADLSVRVLDSGKIRIEGACWW